MFKYLMIVAALGMQWTAACCQDKAAAADSTKKASASLKKYSDIAGKGASISHGLFTVIHNDDKYYLEVPLSYLGQDFLAVTRISAGEIAFNARFPVTPGDELANFVFHFERSDSKHLVVRRDLFTTYSSDSAARINQAIQRAKIATVIGTFTIESMTPEGNAAVIDLTDALQGTSELFTGAETARSMLGLTGLIKENSYIRGIKSFPTNVEFTTLKTFNTTKPTPTNVAAPSGPSTLEINTSIVQLPVKLMQPRIEDARVGYFSLSQKDYSESLNSVPQRDFVKRWKLVPRSEDFEKYKRGELVEPEQPIVFYIDPATPKKWVPYLIEGVNAWQKAFEKAGFKNAIYAREAPSREQDSTWSLYDARYSAIVYKASPIENAMGPSIADPRTGQILESHVSWYHNVLQLLHDWYLVQCGAVDPTARSMVFPDSLMGKLVSFVCTHEVGHTLGLTHNMGASSSVPTDSLRSANWVAKNGICPSIMDYARFNYVAQPKDHIAANDLIGRIGVYDEWAIQWGYTQLPQFGSADEEKIFLSNWVAEKAKDKRLWYGSELALDPRAQTEDLGDDAVKASRYGIENLKRIVPQLREWASGPGRDYSDLYHLYSAVTDQYTRYMVHVVNNIHGGMYETMKYSDEKGPIYVPLDPVKQRAAMRFVTNELYISTPDWLVDSAILSRTGDTYLGVMGELQLRTLKPLFHTATLALLYGRNQLQSGSDAYTITEFLDDLDKGIWPELKSHKAVGLVRRNLQKRYVTILLDNFNTSKPNFLFPLPITGYTGFNATDVTSILYQRMLRLLAQIKENEKIATEPYTKAHYSYLAYKLQRTIDSPSPPILP